MAWREARTMPRNSARTGSGTPGSARASSARMTTSVCDWATVSCSSAASDMRRRRTDSAPCSRAVNTWVPRRRSAVPMAHTTAISTTRARYSTGTPPPFTEMRASTAVSMATATTMAPRRAWRTQINTTRYAPSTMGLG